MIRTMAGHVYMYEVKKDYVRSVEALEWLYAFIESVRKEDAKKTFLDTLKAAVLIQWAVTQARMGEVAKAEELINRALSWKSNLMPNLSIVLQESAFLKMPPKRRWLMWILEVR